MSKKTRKPPAIHDLFSTTGVPEPFIPGHNDRDCAARSKPGSKPRKESVSPPPAEEATNESYLRDLEVARRYGVARQTVWRWAAHGTLPGPVRISEGVTRWRLSDLAAHEASLPKCKTKKVVCVRRKRSAQAGDKT
jgi:predicted DNA-binding transcriptional regulator AlpA